MADDLMTEAAQLHLQRLEEKLLLAETSLKRAETSLKTVESSLREKEREVRTLRAELQNNQKAHTEEIDEIKSRHNNELKELRVDGEKSWMLINHLMRALQKQGADEVQGGAGGGPGGQVEGGGEGGD